MPNTRNLRNNPKEPEAGASRPSLAKPQEMRRGTLVGTVTLPNGGEMEVVWQIPAKTVPQQTHETWRPNLHSYADKRAIRFSSEAEVDSFIDGLWSAPGLRDLPRAHVGDNTVIVPAEAVERLRNRGGFVFTDSPVIPAESAPRRR